MEIISAAGRILTMEGVLGLTTKNLAREMGFAESAIYRHFDSKEQIIIALLEYMAENMSDRLQRVISADKGPRENLEAVFKDQFHFFAQHPHFVVAVFSDGLMEASPKINEAILRIMQMKKTILLPLLAEGQQKGIFTSAIPVEQLLHIVMGAFRLQMFQWRIANFQFDITASGKQLITNLIKLINS